MTPREQLEELELLAEEMILQGDPPVNVGIQCERCGIELVIPWIDRATLIEGMEAHGAVCPMPKKAT